MVQEANEWRSQRSEHIGIGPVQSASVTCATIEARPFILGQSDILKATLGANRLDFASAVGIGGVVNDDEEMVVCNIFCNQPGLQVNNPRVVEANGRNAKKRRPIVEFEHKGRGRFKEPAHEEIRCLGIKCPPDGSREVHGQSLFSNYMRTLSRQNAVDKSGEISLGAEPSQAGNPVDQNNARDPTYIEERKKLAEPRTT
jgi:hypothetical protein